MAVLQAVDGEGGQRVIDSLGRHLSGTGHQVVGWGFGDIYARPG